MHHPKGYLQWWKTHIVCHMATEHLCQHTSTLLSTLFYTAFHSDCSGAKIVFLFVPLIQTRKVCTQGNSPVQLSSPQHWFHAVASAHLFTQLSSDKEAGCSALQPNRANLKMNLDGMFPNIEKRAPTLSPLFVCSHWTEWKRRPQIKHRHYYLLHNP